MEKVIIEIFKSLQNNLPVSVIVAILFLLLLGWILSKIPAVVTSFEKILKIYNKIFNKKHVQRSIDQLLCNGYFRHIMYVKNVKVNTLYFGDDTRNYIVRLLIDYRMRDLEDSIKLLITNNRESIPNMIPEKLEQELINTLQNGIKTYLENFKKNEAHSDEEKIIADILISTIWDNYEHDSWKTYIEMVHSIFNQDDIYKNNVAKLEASLLPLPLLVENWLMKLEVTLKNLNGQLSGKVFHGRIFQPIKK